MARRVRRPHRRSSPLWVLLALLAAGGISRRVQAAGVVLEASRQESAHNASDVAITTLTVGSGAGHYLAVGVGIAKRDVTVSSLKWNGEALSPLGALVASNAGNHCRLEVWGLANPSPGTKPLTAQLTGASAFGVGAASFAGVSASPAPGLLFSAIGNSSPAGAGSAAGSAVIFESVCVGGPWTLFPDPNAVVATAEPGQIPLWDITEPGVVSLGGASAPGGPAPRWQLGAPAAFTWAAISIKLEPEVADAGVDATVDGSADTPSADGAVDAREEGAAADAAIDGPPDAPSDLDGPPAPDVAAPDAAAPDAAAPDVGSLDDAGGAGDAFTPDALPEEDAASDAAGPSSVNLKVGCACHLAGRSRPVGLGALAAAGLLLLGRRRRRA